MSRGRFPVVTAAVCGAALAVYAVEPLARLLIHDRTAIAGGELWRLATGSLVHHSLRHLLWDVAAVAIAGSLIELRRIPGLAALCLAAAPAIGVAVHLVEPRMSTYAGLSGIAVAAMVYLCLHGLREPGGWRWICLAGLAVVAVKIGIELGRDGSLLGRLATDGFALAPVSHLAGAASAALLFAATRAAAVRGRVRIESPEAVRSQP